jgi:hypothetical protein
MAGAVNALHEHIFQLLELLFLTDSLIWNRAESAFRLRLRGGRGMDDAE